MMTKALITQVLRNNPAQFREIYRFNCRPATYVHLDHIPGSLDRSLFSRIAATPRGEMQLSRWILQSRKLADSYCWDFQSTARRLALVDSTTLGQLIDLAGTVVHARQVAQAIDRATRQAVKESLGERLYEFAVKRASLMVGEVPSWLASRLRHDTGTSQRVTLDSVRESGSRCLGLCFSGEPASITERLALKLPVATQLQSDRPVETEEREFLSRLFKKLLIMEIDSSWRSCFN